MQYFFECGNFLEFSEAELCCVFESFGISKDTIKRTNSSILLVESKSISLSQLETIFQRLGGFVRYGEIIDNLDTFLNPYYERKRVTFGVSSLQSNGILFRDIQKLSNEIKRNFRKKNISSRFILPKKDILNAAQMINNNILKEGFELCIFDINDKRVYGKTLGIQDIEAFVKRDIQKPYTDFDMGVLPQKLARIMCNLTGLKEGIVWDPFCGSGTVLMEASVLDFDVLGSDIDIAALESTSKNLKWLSQEGIIHGTKFNVFYLDIHCVERKVVKDLKNTGIDAVVCEPFMGTAQRKVMSVKKAEGLLESVKKLYISLFEVLEKISSKGFKVVLIIPEYKTSKGWITFNVSELIGKKWNVLNRQYCPRDLKWRRNNSIITRNIFILSKR
jgi:tRNA G10  N-methylase Trm11